MKRHEIRTREDAVAYATLIRSEQGFLSSFSMATLMRSAARSQRACEKAARFQGRKDDAEGHKAAAEYFEEQASESEIGKKVKQ